MVVRATAASGSLGSLAAHSREPLDETGNLSRQFQAVELERGISWGSGRAQNMPGSVGVEIAKRAEEEVEAWDRSRGRERMG